MKVGSIIKYTNTYWDRWITAIVVEPQDRFGFTLLIVITDTSNATSIVRRYRLVGPTQSLHMKHKVVIE